jgi:outer membrane protein OmpA-like peptidoglycan-associated protein
VVSRTIVLCAVLCSAARADDDPPTGYRCGDGKPKPGIGCECTARYHPTRDREGVAICVHDHRTTTTPQGRDAQCLQLADHIGDLWGGTGAARERWLALQQCKADVWSTDAIGCSVEKTHDKLAACLKGKLTGDQETKLQDARDTLQERLEKDVLVSEKAIGSRFALFEARTLRFDDTAKMWISAIVDKLRAHPEIEQLEVRAHVDKLGEHDAAIKLTQQRADAVRDELVRLGVDKARVTAKGYGFDMPASDNTTDAGRALNHRVEFAITKRVAMKHEHLVVGARAIELGDPPLLAPRKGKWIVAVFVTGACRVCVQLVDLIVKANVGGANAAIVAVDVGNDDRRFVALPRRATRVAAPPHRFAKEVASYASGVPITYVIDPDGKIVAAVKGFDTSTIRTLSAAVPNGGTR